MVNKSPKWKNVELTGDLFSDGNAEGLIGIEECTDYDLNTFISSSNTNNKRKKQQHDDNADVVKNGKDKKKKKRTHSKSGSKIIPSREGSSEFKVEKVVNDCQLTECDSKEMELWNIVPLPDTILKALAEQSFTCPTQIQMLTLPAAILGRRDILGAAETGSGKTLAFGLPTLCGILKHKNSTKTENDSMLDEETDNVNDMQEDGIGCVLSVNNVVLKEADKLKPLYALILTPTRELAMQIKNHLVAAAKYTGIKIAAIVGGMAAVKQERVLNDCPEIVIATPGRLWELIQQGNKHLSQINNIKYLAIDETDRMLERGHFQELHNILERLNLNDEMKSVRQNFVFSATLTLIHELPKHLLQKKKIGMKRRVADMTPEQKLEKIIAKLGITNPKIVDITKGKGTSETLTECRISCSIDAKDFYVYYFLKSHPGRTLIFCNSIGCVKRLATLLTILNFNPLTLHASLQQRQRLRNLDRFKDKENSILIATDVAARGLDIPFVEHVLHYQTPRTSESYVHRSGRTARASREGITVLLVEPSELTNYLRLCRTLGKSEDLPLFPVKENVLESVKQRVLLAREIDKLQLTLRRTNSETGWLEKAAREMDIIVDEMTAKYDSTSSHKNQKVMDYKKKELSKLLERPLFPRGFSFKYPLSSGQTDIPMVQGEQHMDKAVDVMKQALEMPNAARKKPKILFKSKIKKVDPKSILKPRKGKINKGNKANNKYKGKKGKKSK